MRLVVSNSEKKYINKVLKKVINSIKQIVIKYQKVINSSSSLISNIA